jgi:poly(A) polymerase
MDVSTALALVLPAEAQPLVNEIRAKYDRAYPRWMPHLNLLFPFLPVEQFEGLSFRISKALQEIEPFSVTFSEVGAFKQGRKAFTFHLKVNEITELQKLFKVVCATLPECPPKHLEFHPHLTVAQAPKSQKDAMQAELKEHFKGGLTVTFNQVSLLSRSRTDKSVPFSILVDIPLGRTLESSP